MSVGFKTSTVSVLEGIGTVSVCISKSTDTVIPITVSTESQPLTAISGMGDYEVALHWYIITFITTLFC